jgi:hypothetical protein
MNDLPCIKYTTPFTAKQLKQVGTPTLPTAIPLKSSSSMRATLVFNLFFK